MKTPGFRGAWLALALLMLLTAGVRWRLLDVPLERDEGEYAYAGRLLLEGSPPYQGVYNAKLPGIYLAYAAVMAVFGQSTRGIHLGLLAVNLLSVLLVFLLARRLLGPWPALAAATAFAVLSVGPAVHGIVANAEHFVLVPALGGLLLAAIGLERERPLWLAAGGLLSGCAFLAKQHGIFLVAATAVWLLLAERPARRARGARLGIFAGAAAVPYLLTCIVLLAAGTFDRFWFWTARYAAAYTRRVPWSEATDALLAGAGRVVAGAPLLWLLAVGGLLAVAFDRSLHDARRLLLPLAALSAAAVLPGFLFREHYFLLMLPALALLAAAPLRSAIARGRTLGAALAGGLVLLAGAQSLWAQSRPLFGLTPPEVSIEMYGENPFAESPAIAEIVRELTDRDDRVFVFGSEPQILFYADRRSATGYIYAYPLMEIQPYARRMQEEMIHEVEAARPRVMLFVYNDLSWLRRPGSETAVFEWFGRYRRDFEMVAAVEIRPDGPRFFRGDELARFDPAWPNHVAVFLRRSP